MSLGTGKSLVLQRVSTLLSNPCNLRLRVGPGGGGSLKTQDSTKTRCQASAPNSPALCSTPDEMPSKWGLVLERLVVLGKKFSNILRRIQVFVVRLLELHVLKLVALYIILVALKEVRLHQRGVL